MLIKVLDPIDEIAPQAQGNVLVLNVIPKDGQSFRMFQQNFGFVIRARFVSKGAGMTSLNVQNSPDIFDNPGSGSSQILTISDTTLATAGVLPMPALRLFQIGDSTAPSTAAVWFGFGFPVKDIVATVVRGLSHWAAGDSIFDAKHRWRIRAH